MKDDSRHCVCIFMCCVGIMYITNYFLLISFGEYEYKFHNGVGGRCIAIADDARRDEKYEYITYLYITHQCVEYARVRGVKCRMEWCCCDSKQ